jgi:hypothetical protein
VSLIERRPSKLGAVFLIALGLVSAGGGVTFGFFPAFLRLSWVTLGYGLLALACLGCGLFLLVLGIGQVRGRNLSYSVRIRSPSGEVDALSSRDREQIRRIVDAMDEAIANRSEILPGGAVRSDPQPQSVGE